MICDVDLKARYSGDIFIFLKHVKGPIRSGDIGVQNLGVKWPIKKHCIFITVVYSTICDDRFENKGFC